MKGNFFLFVIFMLVFQIVKSQETLPVYSDYLSDNVYLVHPAAAGINDCSKLRLTARSQWSGVDDAPQLQTISYHSRIGENSGLGGIVYNDKNGFHSQIGILGTYAYHIDLGRPEDAKILSFALSGMFVQNQLDGTSFPNVTDPAISGLVESSSYFNSDIGMAYHNKGFFSYVTVKNLLSSARGLYNDEYETLNLRRYMVSAGYYIGRKSKSLNFEPSAMLQVVERTSEKFLDLNLKVYKNLDRAQIWGGLSYRQGFDGNQVEELRYFSPIVGVNYNKLLISYTYTKQTGDFLFDDGGYHQITLGFNLFCKERKRSSASCPNIYSYF